LFSHEADAERLRFPVGNFTVHSIGPSVTLDFRDDPVNPSKGVLFAWTGEVAHDLGATRTDAAGNPLSDVPIFNFKTTANLTGYVPLAPRVVFALSLRGGRIFPLNPKSETIPPQRFFLGGALSLRGFGEDGVLPADRRADLATEVNGCRALAYPAGCTATAGTLLRGEELPSEGGELFTLGKAELRFPLYGALDLGVFFEAGNLWLSAARYDPLALRYVAGMGVRYLTPVGPLALDLGFNLRPDPVVNEQAFALHFSVGLF
jgi:outer membrane protein assembly factor BamA